MENTQLVVDLVVALGAAFLGGIIAQRLSLPVLLGYIVAGVVIGPNTPGITADRHSVELLANLGVAFLMFALGVEFSFGELKRVRRVGLIAGGIQIPLTILLGMLAGLVVGWKIEASLLLGGAFAISSSIVALKLLMGRGQADSPQAGVALGLGVIQDLSLVPMIAILPVLSGEGGIILELGKSLGIAVVALFAVVVLGTRLVPRLLYAVAKTESRELFLLTVVSDCARHRARQPRGRTFARAGRLSRGTRCLRIGIRQSSPCRDHSATRSLRDALLCFGRHVA